MLEDARGHMAHGLGLNPHLTIRDLPAARALAERLNPAVP